MKFFRIIVLFFFLGCGRSGSVEIEKLKFYNPEFKLDSNAQLSTEGYYQIKEVFRTFLPPTDSVEKPFRSDTTYGFIQCFNDGFCRVGNWNGLYKDSMEVRKQVISGARWRWGLYKIDEDTLTVEYSRKWEKSLFKTIYYRQEIKGIFREGKLFIIEDLPVVYEYPANPDHSAQSCIGNFVPISYDYTSIDNFIKREPEKYLEID